MSKSKQKTSRKVEGRIARHKNVRYHNDAYLFPDGNKKLRLTSNQRKAAVAE